MLKSVLADFSALPEGQLAVAFSAYARALGGAQGTFRLRLGGADGEADGELLATLTATSTSFQMLTASGSVENPQGLALVKLCGLTSVAGLAAQLQSTVVIFRAG